MNKFCFLTMIAFVIASFNAHATLLVYEGFNYDISATHLNGVASTGTGFSGNWSQKHTGAGESNVVSGLSFGSLITSGNAFQLLGDRLTSSNDRYNVANVTLNVNTDAGTIWHSHLVQFQVRDETETNNSTNPNARWQARVSVHDGQHDRTNAPDQFGFSSTRDGSTSQGRLQMAGGTDGGASLNFGETYMVVGKLTGMHDDGTSVTKTADMWVLSLTDFNAVVAANFTEAALNANNVFQITRSVTNDTEISLSGHLNVHTLDWSQRNFNPIYDEIRFGTTMESVMPIPEPGTLVLVGIALGSLLLFRRRR